jgi:hypothetical protein
VHNQGIGPEDTLKFVPNLRSKYSSIGKIDEELRQAVHRFWGAFGIRFSRGFYAFSKSGDLGEKDPKFDRI